MNKLTAVWRGNASYKMFQLQMDAQAHLPGLYFQIISTFSQLVEVPIMAMTPSATPGMPKGPCHWAAVPPCLPITVGHRDGGNCLVFPFFHQKHVAVQSSLITFNSSVATVIVLSSHCQNNLPILAKSK